MPEYWIVVEERVDDEIVLKKLAVTNDEGKATIIFDAMKEAGVENIKLVKVVLD